MDPIFPLMMLAAIAGAATLGWRATRVKYRGNMRTSWKVVGYWCGEHYNTCEIDSDGRCTLTKKLARPTGEILPLSKYQYEGRGTGLWPDKDGPLISSLCEGQWKPSDDESNRPQGRRHAPLFDLDFPAVWTPFGRGGQLVASTAVRLPEYLALLEMMERLDLILPGSSDDAAMFMTRRPDGIAGYRAPGAGVLHEARFQLTVPARLVPSSTAGNFHLYLETEMDWQDYLRLMRSMADAGLLEKGWVDMNERRKMALLRKPEHKKAPS